MNAARDPVSPNAGSNVTDISVNKPDRPCDICRKRKSKCVVKPGSAKCILCDFHQQACTFEENPTPRNKRKAGQPQAESPQVSKRRSLSERPRHIDQLAAGKSIVQDYAELQGHSLLKTTLGLQNHRYAVHLGTCSIHDPKILALRPYDQIRAENSSEGGTFRKVAHNVYFQQFPDTESADYARDVEVLDAIEAIVHPHGEALIKLYFRIVHPSFPILHKKVYLEKYARSHREFIPPLLAAVYISALNWWSYSSELVGGDKPSIEELEAIAFHSLKSSSSRPKLSTIQAGLLLLQNPRRHSAWQLTSQLVSIGQDLGLHRDCTTWHLPAWERGLRKRIAWALYMQSTWSSLIYGRPLHFPPATQDWMVQPVTNADFPESAADEDSEEGSTEVEKGRTLFSAMISLTKTLSEILHTLYSARAEHEIAMSSNRTAFILSRVKHLQLSLRNWYTRDLPHSLRLSTLSTSTIGKLSSLGWLHTSYFACEMTLHRSLLHSLSSASTDPYLTAICRSAARERLIGALDLFTQLRPEHLQSFWYFSSAFNLALLGVFAGICLSTSPDQEEEKWYREQLQGYRWKLRVSSKNADFLEVAVQLLEASVGELLKKGNGQPRQNSVIAESLIGNDGTQGEEAVYSVASLSPVVSTKEGPHTTDFDLQDVPAPGIGLSVVSGFEDYDPGPDLGSEFAATDLFLTEATSRRTYFGYGTEI